MRDYQTLEKLEEKVYEMHNVDREEDTDFSIKEFFGEIAKRKRGDEFGEDGLQASGLIYPTKAAFKINERDGIAAHAHTHETLAQYLDGDTKFTEIDDNNLAKRRDDPHFFAGLQYQCIVVRLLAGEERLVAVFNTKKDDVSSYEFSIIIKCLEEIKTLLKKGVFNAIELHYGNKFAVELTPDKLDLVDQIISTFARERDGKSK